MDEYYKKVPKKEKPTYEFPTSEINDEQYENPIGPKPYSTKTHIKETVGSFAESARSVSQKLGGKIHEIASSPAAQKIGKMAKERTDIFQENISGGYAPKKPRSHQSGRQTERVSIAGTRNDNPFGIGTMGGGQGGMTHSDDPLSRSVVNHQKRRPPKNPFGL